MRSTNTETDKKCKGKHKEQNKLSVGNRIFSCQSICYVLGLSWLDQALEISLAFSVRLTYGLDTKQIHC